ncbi:MAG TPA: polysaccharide deacetylase family protein [Thermoanaerobaculia bacterium]|nr:polysaccharide deacetylase family protein [Thermoanaerobaculia bacterium]
MLRRALKTAGAWTLYATGGDRLVAAARGLDLDPLVLCYHRVVRSPRRHAASAPAMLVSQRTLSAQLDWIGRRYRFVELDELARSVEEKRRQRPPVAAVTFDDGYADVYRYALPVLRRKGIPAAVFVVTDLVGSRRLLLHDRLHVLLREANRRFGASGLVSLLDRHRLQCPRDRIDGIWDPLRVTALAERMLASLPRSTLDRLVAELERYVAVPREIDHRMRPLDWRMLAAMKAAGVTIGSHTRTHRVLPNESPEDVADELRSSKRALEEKLDSPVVHFSYPNGHFSAATLDAVRSAGYRYAYTTCHHRVPDQLALTIPRRTFWEASLAGVSRPVSAAVASCRLRGVFDGRHTCPHDHGLSSRRLAADHMEPARS